MCRSEICKGRIECKASVSDNNLVGKTAEVFVDDTVVKSLEVEDHVNDLATILIRLIANGITLKMEKGIWSTDALPLLDHIVHTGEGVACDPDEVKALAALEPMLACTVPCQADVLVSVDTDPAQLRTDTTCHWQTPSLASIRHC